MINVQFRTKFEPVCGTGGLMVLNQNSGIFYEDAASAFYEVRHVERIPLLGQHGAIVVWSDSGGGVFPGYLTDSQAVSSHIPAAGQAVTSGPLNSLIFPKRMLAQVRFRLKPLVTSGAGGGAITGAAQDYDLTLQAPAATPRWRVPKVVGVMNMLGQVQDPGDLIALPAQGADILLPSAFPQQNVWEDANKTELFLYGGNSVQVTIQNNGVAATASGALALQMSLYLYNLRQIPIGDKFQEIDMLGEKVKVPLGVDLDQVAVVDITGAPIPAAS